jgi:hypothetical protein
MKSRVLRLLLTLPLVLLIEEVGFAQDAGLVLQSSRWPPAAVTIGEDFTILGMDRIEIGAAGADIFVAADTADGAVQRFYWIQFEGFPAGSGYDYDYSSLPYTDSIGGLVFHSDTRYGAYSPSEIRNERDTGTVVGMLRDNGYDVPAPMMRIRMVALDETRENELMIIYLESLALEGLTVDALDADAALWEESSDRLRRRAIAGFGLDYDLTD